MVMLAYYSYAKICSATITKPWYIFKYALAAASFPSEWKKKYSAPIHKINDK